jgi:hypothetical protein
MARASKEKVLADRIAGSLDTLDFNYPHAVFAFSVHGLAVHKNLYELILTFLNKWAFMYENGDVEPGDGMYIICESSHKMVTALTTQRSPKRNRK